MLFISSDSLQSSSLLTKTILTVLLVLLTYKEAVIKSHFLALFGGNWKKKMLSFSVEV